MQCGMQYSMVSIKSWYDTVDVAIIFIPVTWVTSSLVPRPHPKGLFFGWSLGTRLGHFSSFPMCKTNVKVRMLNSNFCLVAGELGASTVCVLQLESFTSVYVLPLC